MDLIKFNLVTLPRFRSNYVAIAFVGLLTFFFIVGTDGIPCSTGEWMITIIASIAGGVTGLIAGFLFTLVFVLLSSKTSNGVLGEHEYEISEMGLLERTQANEGLSKWRGVQEIIVLRSYAAFRISAYLFHLVPARFFDSKQEFYSFCEQATEYWHRHRGNGNT